MIEANVTDDMSAPYATLYYKNEGDETFTALAMRVMKKVYPILRLRFQVSRWNPISPIISKHQMEKIRAEQKNTRLLVSEPNLGLQQIAAFLVTEVVPDSTNVGGADGYEFIEIYNNTNQPD